MPIEDPLFHPASPVQASLLLVGTALLILVAISETLPPAPLPASTPLLAFASARAYDHVKQIGTKTHPTGTAANEEVRQYLVKQLEILGLRPETHSSLVVSPKKNSVARVHNIVVRLTGTKPGKALLLAAHYDSVHTGPGAADDGASVAAILETLRALKQHPPLQNDLICLFTDAEEAGLLGAEAFVKQHPLAKTVGLVLNFEYRGNRGAFMMFETSPGNGKLVAGMAKAVSFVQANSLMYEVYQRLPNDTDFTVFKRAGIPGMNFAAIEGLSTYHTQLDRTENLDQGTLQQEGDIMLALVKQFGNRPLTDITTADRAYFDLPGLGVLHYPVSWVLPMNAGLVLLFVGVFTLALRSKLIRIQLVVASSIVFPLMMFGLVGLSYLSWLAIKAVHPSYQSFLYGEAYNSSWYLLAFVLLFIGLFQSIQSMVYRWLRPLEFAFGIQANWLMTALLSGFGLPGVHYLIFWPLAAFCTALGLMLLQGSKLRHANVLILVGSTPAILIFVPFIKNLFIALSPSMIAVMVMSLLFLTGLLTPLSASIGFRSYRPSFLLISGIAALVVASMTSGFDNSHPRQQSLFYAFDSETQQAYWLSNDVNLNPELSGYFQSVKVRQRVPNIFGDTSQTFWAASAPMLPLQPPIIEILEDKVINDIRTLKLKARSMRQSPKLKVFLEGAEVYSSKIAGQVYSNRLQKNWFVEAIGMTQEDLDIELQVKSGKPFNIKLMDISYDLAVRFLAPMPKTPIPSPHEYSDTAIVVTRLRFSP